IAPKLVGYGRQGFSLGHQLQASVFASSALASGAQPSLAFKASTCFALGTSKASRISRADSALREVRKVGQDRPPPTLSISVNVGDGFSANSRRISVALSGLAFRQMAS